ncbi:MAG: DUF2141 domain-containing protein [Planctomyces sp.]
MKPVRPVAKARSNASCRLNVRRSFVQSASVELTDVKGKDGKLLILLFKKADGFPEDTSRAVHSAKVDIDQLRLTSIDLSASKYVVVVIHDRNNNGKADKSVLGFTREPIGLSNHKKLAPPRPDIEKAKVDLKETKEIKVNMIQLGSWIAIRTNNDFGTFWERLRQRHHRQSRDVHLSNQRSQKFTFTHCR